MIASLVTADPPSRPLTLSSRLDCVGKVAFGIRTRTFFDAIQPQPNSIQLDCIAARGIQWIAWIDAVRKNMSEHQDEASGRPG
jgi:hypothetical protein